MLQLTNKILFWDNMDQITWVRDGVMIKWNKVNINHQPRFKLEYSCHRPPLEFVFLNLVISETIQWKLSRLRLFRDSNFLFLRDRDFSRLQIFKSIETETFPRLQFRVFRDRDFPRLGKSCRDRDFFETLVDL